MIYRRTESFLGLSLRKHSRKKHRQHYYIYLKNTGKSLLMLAPILMNS